LYTIYGQFCHVLLPNTTVIAFNIIFKICSMFLFFPQDVHIKSYNTYHPYLPVITTTKLWLILCIDPPLRHILNSVKFFLEHFCFLFFERFFIFYFLFFALLFSSFPDILLVITIDISITHLYSHSYTNSHRYIITTSYSIPLFRPRF